MGQKFPELVFVCGCNGAGKSTLSYSTIKQYGELYYIDPDRIAKEMNLSIIETGRKVSEIIKNFLNQKISFLKESTLTSKFDFSIVKQAKNIGFKTTLIYVGIDDAELAILRVKERVKNGGHSVPEEDIRRRYERSLANLTKAILIFDNTFVYDNTDSEYNIVAKFRNGELVEQKFTPDWFKKVKEELHLSTTCKFPSASLCSMQHDKANADGQSQAQAPVGKRKRRRLLSWLILVISG